MSKIKRSYDFELDIDNAIGRLGIRLGQSSSQVVENILRKDPEIEKLLKKLHTMPDMPDYVPELSKVQA